MSPFLKGEVTRFTECVLDKVVSAVLPFPDPAALLPSAISVAPGGSPAALCVRRALGKHREDTGTRMEGQVGGPAIPPAHPHSHAVGAAVR